MNCIRLAIVYDTSFLMGSDPRRFSGVSRGVEAFYALMVGDPEQPWLDDTFSKLSGPRVEEFHVVPLEVKQELARHLADEEKRLDAKKLAASSPNFWQLRT